MHTSKTAVFLAIMSVLALLYCFASAENNGDEIPPEPVLRLEPDELSVPKGRGVKVTPSVIDAPKGVRVSRYEWTSSDPEVAEYRDGNVRGIGKGTAVLTCTAKLMDGTELSAECRVTVTVPVSEVKASTKTATVMAGEPFVPEIQVLPEDASNPLVQYASSDEQVLSVDAEGRITAATPGKAVLTVTSGDDPSKQAKITVTVTRRIGKTDRELTFLGIPWESDCETCIAMLKENGFVTQETRGRCSFTASAWHWPENDLLFSRISSWRTMPVAFSDRQTGAARTSLNPQKTIGGYLPQTATLIFLNGMDGEGRIDPETTRLIGVYFSFDNRHERGAVIFRDLLGRLEEQYGEFNRYLSKDIPKYYQELYRQIEPVMNEAKEFKVQEPDLDVYLGEYAVCTIYGTNDTGIMLNMDANETVTLFYGRTDAVELIRELDSAMGREQAILEDAGV